MNKLYFGDNLDVLRAMPAESVDLIYLDPPFNSNAAYGVLYGTVRGGPSQAQARAFEDIWKWGKEAQRALEETAQRHLQAGRLLDSFQSVFSGSNMMAYLAMMAVRLIELHRVLKPRGSVYLHCDPTASHYLKIVLDSIFGPKCYRSEITWKRSTSHGNVGKNYGNLKDIIFFYTKSEQYTWNQQHAQLSDAYVESKFTNVDANGRWQSVSLRNPSVRPRLQYTYTASNGLTYKPHPNGWAVKLEKMKGYDAEGRLHFPASPTGQLRLKQYLHERPGVKLQNIWDDIPAVNSQAHERLYYSTQKPLALLERIICTSSNEGDVVLDPFCGCGTAVEAAERLKRKWIGIDVTYLAMHVIETRLVKAFGESIKGTYELVGRPEDANDARVLAGLNWLEFQKWAVIALGGLPKDRPGPDGGIDGVIRYHRVGIEQPNRAIVSVKGGTNVGVDDIHKLKSVIEREKAEVGVLVCLERPGGPMVREAARAGEVGPTSKRVSRIQIVTVDMLFQQHPVDLPGMIDLPAAGRAQPEPHRKKGRKRIEGQTEMLLPIEGNQQPVEQPKKSAKRNRSIRAIEIEVTRPTIAKRR